MFDFQKSDLPSYFKDLLLDNQYLEFQTRFNRTTGEEYAKSVAYYKGVKFTIFNTYSEFSRITFEGSFHKYWNEGIHNFNDFSIDALKNVLEDIESKFKIRTSDCLVKQLEVGINFRPPYPTKKILQSCLLHKKEPFKWVFVGDEGSYIQAYHCDYIIKIYDKQKHYQLQGFNIPEAIMRYEIKFRREKLNHIISKKGQITLEDVLKFGINNFEKILLDEWQSILFYDFEIFDHTKYQNMYNNINYWMSLKKENFKYHRNVMRGKAILIEKNLQQRIGEEMQKKISRLRIHN